MKTEQGGVCTVSKKRIRLLRASLETLVQILNSMSSEERNPIQKRLLSMMVSSLSSVIEDLALVETGKLR